MFVPKQHQFVTSRATCGCTVAAVDIIDEARVKFNIRLSTVNFVSGGITSRTFYVIYKDKTVEVKFQVEKLNTEPNELQTTH